MMMHPLLTRTRAPRSFEVGVTHLTGRRRRLVAKSIYLKRKNIAAGDATGLHSAMISPIAVDIESEKMRLSRLENLLQEQLQKKHKQFTMLKQVLQIQKALAAQSSTAQTIASTAIETIHSRGDINGAPVVNSKQTVDLVKVPTTTPPSRSYLMQGTNGKQPRTNKFWDRPPPPHPQFNAYPPQNYNRWRAGPRDSLRPFDGRPRFRDDLPPTGPRPLPPGHKFNRKRPYWRT
uniref:Uncharacterized protein n=1 Tax=Spongospora subterranea TaxID=70186 RepID=A0A0H5QYP7_9EUKA|eukprot:CRZ00699.1 hypothetical protein [Spongospora subterranea]